MPELPTYQAVHPVTIQLAADTVAGLRVTRNSSGLHAVQDASERGDYVTHVDGLANEFIAAIALNDGAPRLRVASGITIADGDDIYSAAGGFITNVSTSAQYIGRARGAAAAGQLVQVQLKSVN